MGQNCKLCGRGNTWAVSLGNAYGWLKSYVAWLQREFTVSISVLFNFHFNFHEVWFYEFCNQISLVMNFVFCASLEKELLYFFLFFWNGYKFIWVMRTAVFGQSINWPCFQFIVIKRCWPENGPSVTQLPQVHIQGGGDWRMRKERPEGVTAIQNQYYIRYSIAIAAPLRSYFWRKSNGAMMRGKSNFPDRILMRIEMETQVSSAPLSTEDSNFPCLLHLAHRLEIPLMTQ